MARTIAELPKGSRLTDFISLGVIAKTFPAEQVQEVLRQTAKQSQRERELPAHVVVYYVIALALYMRVSYREVLRCLLEGLAWLAGPGARLKVTGKSGISQARSRLGAEPLRALHDEVVQPIAVKETKGAFYRGWRLVSLDGSTLDVADNKDNERAFGRPGTTRGKSAYPQVRFVGLAECGTHVLFATRMGPFVTGEITLAREVIPALKAEMLCLADRQFFGYAFWEEARATGAALLWRVKQKTRLPCEARLSDGSYLSRIYPSERDRRRNTKGVAVRVIEYALDGVPGAEALYRLVTTVLDPTEAPAEELAALYAQRWEIETALDELKTHLRGSKIVLRSKTPELVRQEFYGLMLAHFAVRGLMHEAALKGEVDPDEVSFTHAVRVIRRKLPHFVAIPPSAQEKLP